jgi:hypothetical protein
MKKIGDEKSRDTVPLMLFEIGGCTYRLSGKIKKTESICGFLVFTQLLLK